MIVQYILIMLQTKFETVITNKKLLKCVNLKTDEIFKNS